MVYPEESVAMFTVTKLEGATYLVGVCLFSISMLVFANATTSFVITTILEEKHAVGRAVGILGFADELVALLACPFWGLLSDRMGTRPVGCYVHFGLFDEIGPLDSAYQEGSCLIPSLFILIHPKV